MASATTYYVSTSGNDSNSGLSLAQAFITLQRAADVVAPGDSVLVEDGNYIGFALSTGGRADARIVFQALGDQVVIVLPSATSDGINVENADYVTLDGFVVNNQPRNGIRLALSDHCVVRNCRCDNNFERGIFTAFTDDILIENNVCTNSVDEHGIYVSNSSDRPIIRYNTCFGNNNIGIHMNGDLSAGGDGTISDAQVYGNIIYDNNLAAGINLDGVENALIFNNLIYDNHFGQGIALFQQDGAVPSRGAKIYNNTIIVPEDGRWGILVKQGANPGTEIINNIIINQHAWRGSIAVEDISVLTSDYNLLSDKISANGDGSATTLATWQTLGLDANSIIAPALTTIFADPQQVDFQLATGSPAIDKGSDRVAAVITEDLLGQARPSGPAYDIGAYEQQQTVATSEAEKSPWRIFPNPARQWLVLLPTEQGSRPGEIELLNVSGQRIRILPTDQSHWSVADLPSGWYMLRIRYKARIGKWWYHKVLIQ